MLRRMVGSAMFDGADPRRDTPANRLMLDRLEQMLADVSQEALKPGYFGIYSVEATVSDGTIQLVRSKVEKQHRL